MAIRRQSWGGAPTTTFEALQAKYGVETRARVIADQEDKEEVGNGGSNEISVGGEQASKPSINTTRSSILKGLFGRFLGFRIGVFFARRSKITRVFAEGEERERKEETSKKKQAQSFQKFKYLNGPKAAAATKSFRHGVTKQKYNSVDLNSIKSRNHEYLTEGIEEARKRGEQGLPYPIENEEAKRRSRGFEAVRRQYTGSARSSAAKRIKAFSYGAEVRHDD